MSNFSKAFNLYTMDEEALISFEHQERDGSLSTKNVSLENFTTFVNSLTSPTRSEDSSEVLEDTGFLYPNLIRRIKRNNSHILTFYYPKVHVNFKLMFYDGNFLNSRLMSQIKEEFSSSLNISSYNSRTEILSFTKALEVPEIFYVHHASNNGRNPRESVLFGVPKPSEASMLFTTPSLDFKNTQVCRSILPNHFESDICWGQTGLDSRSNSAKAFSGDLSSVVTHPYVYLNSVFNSDLLFNGNREFTFNRLSDTQKTLLLDFYLKYLETDNTSLVESMLTLGSSTSAILMLFALAADINIRKEFSSKLRTNPLSNFTM